MQNVNLNTSTPGFDKFLATAMATANLSARLAILVGNPAAGIVSVDQAEYAALCAEVSAIVDAARVANPGVQIEFPIPQPPMNGEQQGPRMSKDTLLIALRGVFELMQSADAQSQVETAYHAASELLDLYVAGQR